MLTALLLIATAPDFDAIRFFSGCTRGEGQLKIVLHARQRVSVVGVGKLEPDGTLVLDQIVTRGTAAPNRRQWRLRRIAPDRYAGTLSDARGAVAGETIGNRLHLTFTGTDGSHIEQWLTLAEDGRSSANVLTAKRLGVSRSQGWRNISSGRLARSNEAQASPPKNQTMLVLGHQMTLSLM